MAVSALVDRFRNNVAPRLMDIFQNGGVEAVVRMTTPNPDPLLPPITDMQSTPIRAVALGVSAQIVAADPTLLVTDLVVRVAAIDYVPLVGAQVSINGEVRTVLRVDALPASGEPAAYRFYVR